MGERRGVLDEGLPLDQLGDQPLRIGWWVGAAVEEPIEGSTVEAEFVRAARPLLSQLRLGLLPLLRGPRLERGDLGGLG